ncbi:MAG: sensor histidine kinase [Anaerolineae bacterium]|jgi:signal transduction histidine kinase
MRHSLTAQQVGYWLSWLAMLSRVASLIYALGILFFYPHPIIAARTANLLMLWAVAAVYTLGLAVLLLTHAGRWLRSAPFIIFDTLLAILIVNLAGGGYRNIFSLYSLIPTVTTALSLPSADKPLRRAALFVSVVVMSTVGFVSSLYFDGYTLPVIIEYRQVDEVVLRSASYWVTGGLLAALAAMMIAWQHSRDRANALREQAAVEEERRRIATDIHDGVLSQLSALSRRAEYASLLLAEDAQAAEEEMLRVVTLAGEVHEGIRWIVRALRQDPAQLTLGGELTRIADRFQRNTGLVVELKLPVNEPQVPIDAIRHMGYIVTEALTNVWKHAGVEEATVVVRRTNGQATVQVVDDGGGFDPVEVGSGRAGLGLWNMRERAQEIGGDIDIRSSIGGGTQVTIIVPLVTHRDGRA